MNLLLSAGDNVSGLLDWAVSFWNRCWSLIIEMLTTSPQTYSGSGGNEVWSYIRAAYQSVLPVGSALLTLFFFIGFTKTAGMYFEMKRPEQLVKALLRLILAYTFLTNAFTILCVLMRIGVGIAQKIVGIGGLSAQTITMPTYLQAILSQLQWKKHLFQAGASFLIAFVGTCAIMMASISALVSVYGRFFRFFMYFVLAPIPLSTFAGEPTQHIGINYLKAFCAVSLECASIAVACLVFSVVSNFLPDIGVSSSQDIQGQYEAAIGEYGEYESLDVNLDNPSYNDYTTVTDFGLKIGAVDGTNPSFKYYSESEWNAMSQDEKRQLVSNYYSKFEDLTPLDIEDKIDAVGAHKALLSWLAPVIFNMFLLLGVIKSADQVTSRIMGL